MQRRLPQGIGLGQHLFPLGRPGPLEDLTELFEVRSGAHTLPHEQLAPLPNMGKHGSPGVDRTPRGNIEEGARSPPPRTHFLHDLIQAGPKPARAPNVFLNLLHLFKLGHQRALILDHLEPAPHEVAPLMVSISAVEHPLDSQELPEPLKRLELRRTFWVDDSAEAIAQSLALGGQLHELSPPLVDHRPLEDELLRTAYHRFPLR